jgi:hypothetical protein
MNMLPKRIPSDEEKPFWDPGVLQTEDFHPSMLEYKLELNSVPPSS